ncbi:MAG: hypothetical protein VX681_03555 [Myxococcota bacterium]|nr:hypothetical protein [Myxococcota bacterium]
MSARGAAISLAAGALLLLHAAHFDHIADDAYISLRYLDHWLRGEGLVFNPGERVMGYSNFLWIVALAPLAATGLSLPAAAQGLGAAAAFACVALVCNELVRRHAPLWPALAAGGWLAASAPFALWAQAGLEGPLFALWLTGAQIGACRHAEQPSSQRLAATALCLVAAAWTRPEGAAYGLVVACWLGWRTGRRDALLCLAASLGAWLVFGGFALVYYGDWLPNTYYAKAHPLSLAVVERGWLFTWAYLKGQYGATAIAIVLFAATAGRSARAPGWLGVAMLATFVAFYLRIGGDALVYHRMWATVQPLIAIALGDAVGSLLARPSVPARAIAAVGCLLPLLALPHSLRGFELSYLRADDERIRSLGVLGRELAERVDPDTVIATNVIGALGFYSRLPLIDMLGLTNRQIAHAGQRSLGTPGHESHDGAYVLDREPDLILVGIPRASHRRIGTAEAFRPAFPSDRDLAADQRLLRDYVLRHWTLRDGRHVALFARRGYQGAPNLE